MAVDKALRRCCVRFLSSRLAIGALSFTFCFVMDRNLSRRAINHAVHDRSDDGTRMQWPASPDDLSRRLKLRRLDLLAMEADGSLRSARRNRASSNSTDLKPRLDQLVTVSPRFAINDPHTFCTLEETKASRGLILIWVYSAPGNVDARARIRTTWGSVKAYGGFVLRVAFFVGRRSQGDENDKLLANESSVYSDIVQDISYIDSYSNLSLKGASGLKWITSYCAEGTYAVKVDDDTLVSPFALVSYLRATKIGQSIACKVQVKAKPQRKSDKWYEDPLDFSAPVYPNYCQGFAYVIPIAVIPLLEASIGKTQVPRMEDVYVTGVLAEFAGITHLSLPKQAWLSVFPKGYEQAVDTQGGILFISDTFIPSRVEYFWAKQKAIYNWSQTNERKKSLS